MTDTQIAEPPSILPESWEAHHGFRETFLVHFTEPRDNLALRRLGRLLYDMAMEYCQNWPVIPEDYTVTEMRAVLADLRFLQGLLEAVARGREATVLTAAESRLAHLAERYTVDLGRMAGELEQALGSESGQP